MLKTTNFIILNWLLALTDKEAGKKIDFAVGGQAVIEGVMMRSPNNIAIAVRKESGKIKVKKRKYQTITQRIKALNIPVVRGVINLFEMMVIGTQAINFSANEQMLDLDEQPKTKQEKLIKLQKAYQQQLIKSHGPLFDPIEEGKQKPQAFRQQQHFIHICSFNDLAMVLVYLEC